MRNAQAAGKNQFRNCCKVLTASPPTGLSLLDHWLRLTPARMAPSFTGADKRVQFECPVVVAHAERLLIKDELLDSIGDLHATPPSPRLPTPTPSGSSKRVIGSCFIRMGF